MNLAILCGRTTAEPNIQMTNSGKKVCRFTLAIDDGKNADGSRKTQFIDCEAWNQSAEFLERYVHKGMRILVQGKLNKTSYEKDGQKHYPTTVVCDRMEFADGSNQTAQPVQYAEPQRAYTQPSRSYSQTSMMSGSNVPSAFGEEVEIDSDELPF